MTYDRRRFLTSIGAAGVMLAQPTFAANKPRLHVVRDPDCGCCMGWAQTMVEAGFDVTVQNVAYDDLQRLKVQSGVRPELASCHTGKVDGYVIEGHVPAADVFRLLQERPDAIGLTVPGMPYGSPGMGPESERDAYSVFLIGTEGMATLFNHYPAA